DCLVHAIVVAQRTRLHHDVPLALIVDGRQADVAAVFKHGRAKCASLSLCQRTQPALHFLGIFDLLRFLLVVCPEEDAPRLLALLAGSYPSGARRLFRLFSPVRDLRADVVVEVEKEDRLIAPVAHRAGDAVTVALIPTEAAEEDAAESARGHRPSLAVFVRPTDGVAIVRGAGAHGQHALYGVEKKFYVLDAPHLQL